MKQRICFHLLLILGLSVLGSSCQSNIQEDISNPLLPGYFADPTVKKFGDIYFIYSTTDGIKLASGEPTVWMSKDLINWYNYELDIAIPIGLTNCWAPDVVKGKDNKYYYYMGNCERGCNIYGYVSDNPIGPWTALNDGKAVIPVGTGLDRLPALDAQFLMDDDKLYSYFGTWCTSFGALGWARINTDDMFSIQDEGNIPIEQIPLAFEAAYPIKKGDKYILMYSAGDCRLSSYAVHYAIADSPEGPFRYGQNNPILASSEDGFVDGPGHHSILFDEDNSYIFYHRHDNPHSTGGEFRQVCANPIKFRNDSVIEKINPKGAVFEKQRKSIIPLNNLTYCAKTKASSHYHLISEATRYTQEPIDFHYKAAHASDNDNGTLWKAESHQLPQSITMDLGHKEKIARIMTFFEYPSYYYQYFIEVSKDSITWQSYSDKRNNRRSGSPMIDDKDCKARYLRITITGTEKNGMIPAIWEIKAFSKKFWTPKFQNKEIIAGPGIVSEGKLLLEMNLEDKAIGVINDAIVNTASLGGEFLPYGNPEIKRFDGTKCLYLDGKSCLRLNKKAPESLAWNSPFTVSAWVLNPEIGYGECILSWNSRKKMLQSSYAALMYGNGHYGAMAHGDGAVDVPYSNVPEAGVWNHICVSFDGAKETVYVNGVKNKELPINLFVKNDQILIGSSGAPHEYFSGYIYHIQLWDRAFDANEINTIFETTKP